MKKILPIIFLIFLITGCKEDKGFVIKGRLLADLDSMYLAPGFVSKKFVDTILSNLKTPVVEGKFCFEGKMPYPHMLNFYSPEFGISKPFFIENGESEVSVAFLETNRDVVFNKGKPKSQSEYESLMSSKLV